MKVAILATIAALAIAQAAPSPSEPGRTVYYPDSDETCTLSDNDTMDCVPGRQNNAPEFDDYFDDVVTDGNDKRGLAQRGVTCAGFWGPGACIAKCLRIHGKYCGGRCLGGGGFFGKTCYCSAKC